MITVGTPGLGVRHPHGSTLTFFHPDIFPSGRFSIRLADAQTGRPYSNHYSIRKWEMNFVIPKTYVFFTANVKTSDGTAKSGAMFFAEFVYMPITYR
jgi:hypothetical protein